MTRPQYGACREDRITGLEVFPGGSNVVSPWHLHLDQHRIAVSDGLCPLDHHHSVSPHRQRGAGHDAHGTARTHLHLRN